MVFTTVAYYEDQAANGLTPYAAVSDQHVKIDGDDITVPAMNHILGVQCLSANLEDARLVAPSLRRLWNLDIHPILNSAKPLTTQAVDEGGAATYDVLAGQGFMDLSLAPIPLVVSEKLNLEMNNGNNAEDGYGVVFLTDALPSAETGKIMTIKASNTDTLTGKEWTNGELEFAQSLPAGRYRVVGMAAKSANLIAARLVFIGGSWRPGCIGKQDWGDARPEMFRFGRLGNWGEFEFDTPPSVDFLSNAGDSEQFVWLDLIQIREGR